MGEVAEPAVEGNCADVSSGKLDTAQHAISQSQPAFANEVGKGHLLAVEQGANISRRYALTDRHRTDGQVGTGQIGENIRLDRLKTRSTQAAVSRNRRRVAGRTERKSSQIMDMRCAQRQQIRR